MRIRFVRRLVQVGFLALFAALIWRATWNEGGAAPARMLFLKMDPLAMVLSTIADPQAWVFFPLAIAVLGLTVAFGRFFCGWICPLGTCVDAGDRLIRLSRGRRLRLRERAQAPHLKYAILGGAVLSAALGAQIGWFFDPIPLLTRTFSVVLYPLAVWLGNIGAMHGRPLLLALGVRAYPTADVSYSLSWAVAILFVAVLGLGLLSRRYWCRTLCPLGALLGLVGRFGLWRRTVEVSCTQCRLCVRDCKMGAIPAESPAATRTAECILCYDCLSCPGAAAHSRIGLFSGLGGGADTRLDTERRRLLLGIVTGVAAGLAYGAAGRLGLKSRPLHRKLIRPPGAIVRRPGNITMMGEQQFRDTCLRCGACMRACPTSGLQPAVTEAGFDGVFTPVLVPRVGECVQNCVACGAVCPSGALVPFTVEEKARAIVIGLAEISRETCLSWRPGDQYRLCLVCDEQCPYDAVDVREHSGRRRPFVVRAKCTGCGKCENVCPVGRDRPVAAIVVNTVSRPA